MENARIYFKGHNGTDCSSFTGITDDFSFFNNRSVINCAEIWAAREAIMGGSRFEDISFSIYHLRDDPDSRFIAGDIFHPCENCQQTFKEILENLGG